MGYNKKRKRYKRVIFSLFPRTIGRLIRLAYAFNKTTSKLIRDIVDDTYNQYKVSKANINNNEE